MLVHHLLSGIIIGALVTLASLLQGFSTEAMIGSYVIGAMVGVSVSVVGALSAYLQGADKLTSAVQYYPEAQSSPRSGRSPVQHQAWPLSIALCSWIAPLRSPRAKNV